MSGGAAEDEKIRAAMASGLAREAARDYVEGRKNSACATGRVGPWRRALLILAIMAAIALAGTWLAG